MRETNPRHHSRRTRQRFKNILAYVDLALDKHPALARGMRLARHNNVSLTAMTVIEEHPAPAHAILRSIHVKDALETIEHEYLKQLEQIVQPGRDAGRFCFTRPVRLETKGLTPCRTR